MKESLDQQAAHNPSPSTGSRQAAQSCGSATPSATPKKLRAAPRRRDNRPGRASAAVMSVDMAQTLSPRGAGRKSRRADDFRMSPARDRMGDGSDTNHHRSRVVARPPAARAGARALHG